MKRCDHQIELSSGEEVCEECFQDLCAECSQCGGAEWRDDMAECEDGWICRLCSRARDDEE